MGNSITLSADTLFNELMWQATRYCIGRRSYVSSYAEDYWRIIQKNWDKFYYDRLKFFARDIRAEVSSVVHGYSNVFVDNAYNDCIVYDAYTLIARYFATHSEVPENTRFIVNCISGEVATNEIINYNEIVNHPQFMAFRPSEWEHDLLPWIRLANCIDRQYEVDYEVNERIEKEICIQEPDGTYACVDRWNALLCPEFIKEVKKIWKR